MNDGTAALVVFPVNILRTLAGTSLVLAAAATGIAETDLRRDAVVEAVDRVLPSVVNIGTATLINVQDPFEQWLREYFTHSRARPRVQYSLGSGVIVDEAGYILTNDHVVRRANRIAVTIHTNSYEAKLIASSPRSDVALIKIEPRAGEKFRAVRFGRDDDILLGETVLALGNPFGLGGSVSRGILSSKNRRAPADKGQLEVEDWLQTDAAINPGNSGGPLVNLRGELIGLNVAVFREGNAEGIGFAIPIKRVAEALSEIFTPEGTQHIWFGARIRPNLNALTVGSVEPGSPAAKGGLRVGDVILQIGEKVPRNLIEFVVELLQRSKKSEVPLLVARGTERRSLNVKLVSENTVFNADLIRQRMGATFQELTVELAESLGLNSTEGFLIASVDRNGPADAAGLKRGYLITSMDGQAPEDLIAAAKILNGKKKGEHISLAIVAGIRRGNFIEYRQGTVDVKLR